MEEMINQLITTAEGLGLLAIGYLLWFLTGVVNSKFNTHQWSWKKTRVDIAKAVTMGAVMLGLVFLANGLDWYAGSLGFDISQLMDNCSVAVMTGGIILGCVNYYGKAVLNSTRFFKLKLGELATPEQVNYSAVAEPTKQVISDIVASFYTPKEAVEAHEQFELEGGRGYAYGVDITSYDAFRANVIGKGFDVDGSYGAQCWDACALVWIALGRSLQTGNGCAYGCWNLKRDANAGSDFELVTDASQIKRGDVLVFRSGEFGHIGYADEDYSGSGFIKLLGQNQGGADYPNGGSAFNVVNMSMATFLGGFRYKKWGDGYSKATIKPATEVKTSTIKTETTPTPEIKKGDFVAVTRFVDVDGTPLRQDMGEKFLVYQVSKLTQTAVLKSDDGDIYARISFANIRKID